MNATTDESLLFLDELDFSEELPIPPDISTSFKTGTSRCSNSNVTVTGKHLKPQVTANTETVQAKHETAASDNDTDFTFDHQVFVTCSTALGAPCYRNPVYGERSDRTDSACQRLASKHPQVHSYKSKT